MRQAGGAAEHGAFPPHLAGDVQPLTTSHRGQPLRLASLSGQQPLPCIPELTPQAPPTFPLAALSLILAVYTLLAVAPPSAESHSHLFHSFDPTSFSYLYLLPLFLGKKLNKVGSEATCLKTRCPVTLDRPLNDCASLLSPAMKGWDMCLGSLSALCFPASSKAPQLHPPGPLPIPGSPRGLRLSLAHFRCRKKLFSE